MNENEQIHNPEEFDYNREPPLDQATTSMNRSRSKYVFMTLCFLLALVLLYTHINGNFAGDSSTSWFPLVGAVVLTTMGIVFLRSSDNPPTHTAETFTPTITHSQDGESFSEQTLSPFEELVREALSSIPAEFHEQMKNVAIHVADEPDEEVLARAGAKEGYTLFGLYEGVPLTSYGSASSPYPEVITIYQRPIEDHCRHNPTRIREQVRTTVLHEVAHHFGMGHAEMPIWMK